MPRLISDRLVLREFQPNDFDAVHSYGSDEENTQYMIWGPNSEEETRMFIKGCMEWRYRTPRLHYDFAITLKDSNKVIGGCGIYLNEAQNEAMIGWILHKDYWKMGYMPEAAMCLLKYGFEVLKLHRMYATCNAENYGSYRVMEKCGMRREAHFIQNKFGRVGMEKQWYDEFHYGILRDEWNKRS